MAEIVSGEMYLLIIEGPSQGNSFPIPKHKVSIGRKQNNEFNFS